MVDKSRSRARELMEQLNALDVPDDLLPSAEDRRAFAVLFRRARICWAKCEDTWGCQSESQPEWANEFTPEMEMAFQAGRVYGLLLQNEASK